MFLVDQGDFLDRFLFHSDLPGNQNLDFEIEIDRFVGDTDANGYLLNHQQLVDNKVISEIATLTFPIFDVDDDFIKSIESDPEPERNEIYVVKQDGSEILLGTLTSGNQNWELMIFEVDTKDLRFPSFRGSNGSSPTKVKTRFRIKVDLDNPTTENVWATEIDWATIKFKAMAPVVMIAGYSGNPFTFTANNFTDKFEQQRIPFDNTVSLAGMGLLSMSKNAEELKTVLSDRAKSFGVEHLNLICHSKGGIDARHFIRRHLKGTKGHKNRPLLIESVNCLSTPFFGTVLGDLVASYNDHLIDIDKAAKYLNKTIPFGEAIYDMTTDLSSRRTLTSYSARTMAHNPSDDTVGITWRVFSGDSNHFPRDFLPDNEGNDILSKPLIRGDEYIGLRNMVKELKDLYDSGRLEALIADWIVKHMYRQLWNYSEIEVQLVLKLFSFGAYPVLVRFENVVKQDNDTVVTRNSAEGKNELGALLVPYLEFGMQYDNKDHGDIVGSIVAQELLTQLKAAQ